jgi:hypothetical protein
MRTLTTLLLLAAAALADDAFPSRLQAFEQARRFTLEPGGQARVLPAVDALIDTDDVRAVAPVAEYLLETIQNERRLFEELATTQRAAADLKDRSDVLAQELKQLELKEKAGDRMVGPAIEARTSERSRCQREFEELRGKVTQVGRAIDFQRELRDRLADGCAALLKALAAEQVPSGIASLRRALDPADREQALFLVRILAGSGQAQAEEQLIEILTQPNAADAVRTRAQFALGRCLSRRGADVLLRLWERDPEHYAATAGHVLSLKARRRLASLEEARAFVASLP